MEVKTVDETAFSLRTMATYGAITVVLVLLFALPSLITDTYARFVNTLLLFAILGLVGRTFFSTLLSFSPVEPPAIPEDADLPSVSVVIPAYEEEPVLPETIEACRNLDYPAEKLEVVLCYEADSTDATGDICEQAAADDPRFTAVERDEPGGGKAKATNFALQHATGDIIASIDADHQFEPGAVRRAVAWFHDDEDVWCVKGRCYGRNPTDSLLALHATVERHIAERADIFARQVFDGFTFFGGGQAFFRTEVFEQLGAFDEEILVEDIDMSSRIHEAGKEIIVDPGIITFEENPVTLEAWWSQRKRWARGWMQVAVRYMKTLPRRSTIAFRKRLDAAYTFAYAIVPVMMVMALPMAYFRLDPNVNVTTFVPLPDTILWNAFAVAPAVVAYMVFLADYREGLSHHPREYLAAFTLWFYLIFQTLVFITAFIEEFLLRKPSVYVTTSRADEEEGGGVDGAAD